MTSTVPAVVATSVLTHLDVIGGPRHYIHTQVVCEPLVYTGNFNQGAAASGKHAVSGIEFTAAGGVAAQRY